MPSIRYAGIGADHDVGDGAGDAEQMLQWLRAGFEHGNGPLVPGGPQGTTPPVGR
jgi:hypothetical protein